MARKNVEFLPAPDSPLIRRVPVCPETKRGDVEAYVYQTRCVKCGGRLDERNCWEVIRWKNGARLVRLVCEPCARAAILYYRKV